MKKSNIFSKILTIVMIMECLLIVITVAKFWVELTYDYTWYENEDALLYEMEDERYGWLLCNYYTNLYGGYEASGNMEECYGVAKYFEAALWYNAYEAVGDTQQVSVYAEKMSEAYEEMGDYQFLEEKIKAKLNMQ
ncbi:MAG: hypothetical protein IJZ82_05525 [Lachnospiraceae bacterium]|nr:hypothetical protein [Lachnospiraceae bacterium]